MVRKPRHLRMLWMTLVLTLPVRRLAKAMHKKWPWHPTQEMYQTPLVKLRPAQRGAQPGCGFGA